MVNKDVAYIRITAWCMLQFGRLFDHAKYMEHT